MNTEPEPISGATSLAAEVVHNALLTLPDGEPLNPFDLHVLGRRGNVITITISGVEFDLALNFKEQV